MTAGLSSRRAFAALVLGGIVTVSGVRTPPNGAAIAGTVQSPDAKELRLQLISVGGIVYQLMGGGGSSLVLIREDNVVLIDSKPHGWGTAVLEAVARLTDLPVTTVIHTDAHLDRVGGSLDIPTLIDIVAHENAARLMKTMSEFSGAGTKALPNKIVGKHLSLFEGRDRVDLYHFGRGHTDGDLVVVFPEHKIAYLGDLFPLKGVPSIDAARGGSVLALADTLGAIAREIKGVERVVAGRDLGPPAGKPRASFGDLHSWSDFEEYAAFNRDLVAAARTAMSAGKTPEQALTGLALAAKYPGYDLQHARANVEILYRELTAQRSGTAPAR